MTTLQDMLKRQRRGSSGKKPTPRPRQHFGAAPISEEPPPAAAIRVIILSYDRPKDLEALVGDIERCRGQHDVSLVVYDDASTSDYTLPRETIDRFGGQYIRAKRNHGKQRFWQWVSRVYGEQRTRAEPLYVLLPDDMRLCERFFDRVLNAWARIKDPKKVALNLCRDDSRDGKSCWTEQAPIDCGPVFDIGWVDGAILCNRRYFEALGWNVRSVHPDRWRKRPHRSSGVGEQLSLRLAEQSMGMYGVKRSLVAHVGGPSKMNVLERRLHPLRALHFIDGDAAHQMLAGVPTPPRGVAPSLPRRVASRRPASARHPTTRHRAIQMKYRGGVKKKS